MTPAGGSGYTAAVDTPELPEIAAIPEIALVCPDSPAMWEQARQIIHEYGQSLDIELDFQNFDEELRTLPGEYAEPQGTLLLALVDGQVAGCGGFRPMPDSDYPNACEMKRLFVRPAFRRFGLGRTLAQALIDRATSAGYSTMLLDTLDDMEAARDLYESLGFTEIPPYYYNPIAGAHYLKVELN